jgi:hypothetical protein
MNAPTVVERVARWEPGGRGPVDPFPAKHANAANESNGNGSP